MNNHTFYLFARPSFAEGMARVLDLGGNLQVYNEHETTEEADLEALRRDWKAVGKDIKIGIREYEREQRIS